MKISVDVDISPKEARELMGWPDMSKLYETSISTLSEQMQNGNTDAMMSMLKPYLDGSQQAFSFYQKMFEGLASTGTAKK
ncbi:hypothetical protein CA267_007320 [Alteromonas pelagimontana]|uniref:Uncharacterized protein n=1 Tax=Alteromonas pelagimontana TaxID=1858656 RepID=A0A6M4MC27_9ALTE|nr:DUF6489 family protein [Alteromonas pelagimontana]QJR80599.1 hypothetical protein CA267_007320 [Alteromonas pelagimontana]